MIFVTADLHGYPLSEFKKLLQKADFNGRDDDFLFILGDVIDRNGDGGISILRWLTEQANAELLLGNHEAMLLSCEWIFDTITDDSLENITSDRMGILSDWIANGAEPTLKTLKAIMRTDPDTVYDIFDYLKDCPLYDTVTAGNRDFILCHAGLSNFSPNKKLSAYTPDELLWHRPKITDRYFKDTAVIFGHTPTDFYGAEHKGKIVFTDTWIDIDTGDVPTILRLDDMKCFRCKK